MSLSETVVPVSWGQTARDLVVVAPGHVLSSAGLGDLDQIALQHAQLRHGQGLGQHHHIDAIPRILVGAGLLRVDNGGFDQRAEPVPAHVLLDLRLPPQNGRTRTRTPAVRSSLRRRPR
nr:hypothetical protein [Streptomyces geranii]